MDATMLKQFQETLEKSINETMEKTLPDVIDASVQKKFDSEIEEKINAALKSAGLDKIGAQGFAEGQAGNTQKENALKFFKAVFNRDKETLKAIGADKFMNQDGSVKTMTEGTDSAGGFLVPEETMNEIDRVADNYGLIRNLARVIPMGKDILNMPTLGSKPNVYWPGEAGAGTASQPVLKNVKLEAKTAVGLTPVSNEFLEDANIGVVQYIVELFAEQLAGEEDNQGLNGVGAPFTGVLNSTETNTATALATHDTLAEVTLKDLRDAVASVKSSVLPGSVWIFHRTVWNQLVNLQEGSQTVAAFAVNPVIMDKAGVNGLVPSAMLFGYPVYLSDLMPSAPAATEAYGIFGNFSKFYFGNRKQMAVSTSEHATVGGVSMFETNSQALRVIERVALAVGVGEAFTILKLAA